MNLNKLFRRKHIHANSTLFKASNIRESFSKTLNLHTNLDDKIESKTVENKFVSSCNIRFKN